MAPFLVSARNGSFVGKELLELAADCGCVVVAGDFAFDLVEDDIAVVAFGGFWGGDRGRVGVDVLFVSRGAVVLRGGFGVGFFAVRCGGWTAGTTRCFGHCGSLLLTGELARSGTCLRDRVVRKRLLDMGICCLLQVCVERDQPHSSRLGNAESRDYQIDDCPLSIRYAMITFECAAGLKVNGSTIQIQIGVSTAKPCSCDRETATTWAAFFNCVFMLSTVECGVGVPTSGNHYSTAMARLVFGSAKPSLFSCILASTKPTQR